MSSEKKIPKEVEYKFEKADGYRVIHVNGVWGGVTPHGEIKIELFSESPTNPDLVIHEVTAEGQVGQEIERIPKLISNRLTIVREIHIGAIISPDTAESIANWLLNTVKQARGV
ncbi:MAG TPA: hypothetical protein VFF49_02040 [Thermodesulfobacteriota bacterium]|nr:hypothetical protein [Thermodesulfobacteriota bacterium]